MRRVLSPQVCFSFENDDSVLELRLRKVLYRYFRYEFMTLKGPAGLRVPMSSENSDELRGFLVFSLIHE
jgi:hypothetical protein